MPVKEVNRTVQDLKVEIESTKKILNGNNSGDGKTSKDNRNYKCKHHNII